MGSAADIYVLHQEFRISGASAYTDLMMSSLFKHESDTLEKIGEAQLILVSRALKKLHDTMDGLHRNKIDNYAEIDEAGYIAAIDGLSAALTTAVFNSLEEARQTVSRRKKMRDNAEKGSKRLAKKIYSRLNTIHGNKIIAKLEPAST